MEWQSLWPGSAGRMTACQSHNQMSVERDRVQHLRSTQLTQTVPHKPEVHGNGRSPTQTIPCLYITGPGPI